MLPLNMNVYLALLWGISASFFTESMTAPTPVTSNIYSTVEPSKTTKELTNAHAVHSETETQHATWHPTYKPAEVSVSVTAETTVAPTMKTEGAITTTTTTTTTTDSTYNDSTFSLVAMTAAVTTASSTDPRLLHTSTAVTTGVGGAQPLHNTTISKTAKPTEDQLHQQSSTTSTDMTPSATTSAASSATETVFSPEPTSTPEPKVTSNLSSTTSPADSTQTPDFTQRLSSPSASATTKMTENLTSQPTTVSEPTSFSTIIISETSTNSTELSSTSQPLSVTKTRVSTDTGGSSSTAEPSTISLSTDSANTTTAAVSTSPAGIIIHRVPKKLPIPTTKSTPVTEIAPPEASKSPASTEVQPCSTRGLVKHCLIAIASLAALATIFMVSTIILCTKLSASKYKLKKPQEATEMMCISALLPERNYAYARQRNPVTNGVLVIHRGSDSDEDGGDNVTLSSFLPENDRFV